MKKTYQGSCHCEFVKFEIQADITHARVCDCSVCFKRGALNFRVEDKDLNIHTNLDEMTLYQWHTKVAKDYFCPRCGILPFRRPRTAAHLWTINLRCLDGLDFESLTIKKVNGSQLD